MGEKELVEEKKEEAGVLLYPPPFQVIVRHTHAG